MSLKKRTIQCCKGDYHIFIDGKYYCLAPPDIECSQVKRAAGKFTKGEKKILYCSHQVPCAECKECFGNTCDTDNTKRG